ncbi:MAG TPA: SIS domain-containing protein [Ktedonobacterales bacterium]
MTSMLEQEILSQPAVISDLLEHETQHIQQIVTRLPDFEYIVIAARGSSDHAATYAKYVWSALGGYPVALAAPSLHTLYRTPPRLRGALVVGISQSGQSPDIVAVLEEGRRQGRPTVAITNDGASPLASSADYVVDLRAGVERSVAATKTYTAQLAVVAAFAAHWSGDEQRRAELEQLPGALAATVARLGDIAKQIEPYRAMAQCTVIGRGYNYATTLELALKLKEVALVIASPYSAADFRHGPIATVDAQTAVVLVMPTGQTFDDLLDVAGALRQRGAELLVISDAAAALAQARTPLPLAAAIPEWLSPIHAIIPGQALALHLAVSKGLNPDLPPGLQKVTRTF